MTYSFNAWPFWSLLTFYFYPKDLMPIIHEQISPFSVAQGELGVNATLAQFACDGELTS